MHIRRAAATVADDYRSPLVPGLRSSADAQRLAAEVGFSVARLAELAAEPPGLYAEVAGEPDAEEATWLAFLIAYLSPGDGEDPFAGVAAARVPWATGEAPALGDARTGPRTAHDPARGAATIEAYRRWAARAGSQQAAFAGEPDWSPERRFARAFERLSLPGLHREARFELLVTLGRTGRHAMSAGSLFLGAAAPGSHVAVAARRVFGIADPMLIDRRATELAHACQAPLEALDLALFNWQIGPDGERATMGARDANAHEAERDRAAAALGV